MAGGVYLRLEFTVISNILLLEKEERLMLTAVVEATVVGLAIDVSAGKYNRQLKLFYHFRRNKSLKKKTSQ